MFIIVLVYYCYYLYICNISSPSDLMKSIVVDESLSTNASRVLFQRKSTYYFNKIIVVDANVAQIITRFDYSLFGKAKKWFNQRREGRLHAIVAVWSPLKEQFKHQFNPVGNTREEQMASQRNIKWDANETLD